MVFLFGLAIYINSFETTSAVVNKHSKKLSGQLVTYTHIRESHAIKLFFDTRKKELTYYLVYSIRK